MWFQLRLLTALAVLSICASGQGEKEKVSYDKFKDLTTVTRIIPLGEEGEQLASLNLVLSFDYPGKVYVKPGKVYFGLSSFYKRWRFLNAPDRRAILLIDGERVDLGVFERSGSQIEAGAIYELVGKDVAPETIQKLARAKKIEMQVGQFEKELAAHHKVGIKEFGELIEKP